MNWTTIICSMIASASLAIAVQLGTGEQNIKVHHRRLIRKMGANSLAELVRCTERLGVKPAM